jgi:hypothetical protein
MTIELCRSTHFVTLNPRLSIHHASQACFSISYDAAAAIIIVIIIIIAMLLHLPACPAPRRAAAAAVTTAGASAVGASGACSQTRGAIHRARSQRRHLPALGAAPPEQRVGERGRQGPEGLLLQAAVQGH